MSKLRGIVPIVGAFCVAALCAASLYTMIVPPKPILLYNKTNSAPIGWYKIDPKGLPMRDKMVAAYVPEDAILLAHMREYLPRHIPVLKTVWASGGDKICSNDGVIVMSGRPDIIAKAEDNLGRKLPSWQGCITLSHEQIFLVSTHVETSFDSRYFGPVHIDNVLGTAEYVGPNPIGFKKQGGRRRLGAGLGAEGKIKGGVPPSRLKSCLHIFFGGHSFKLGVHPFSAAWPMPIGFEGVHPLKLFNVYKGQQ